MLQSTYSNENVYAADQAQRLSPAFESPGSLFTRQPLTNPPPGVVGYSYTCSYSYNDGVNDGLVMETFPPQSSLTASQGGHPALRPPYGVEKDRCSPCTIPQWSGSPYATGQNAQWTSPTPQRPASRGGMMVDRSPLSGKRSIQCLITTTPTRTRSLLKYNQESKPASAIGLTSKVQQGLVLRSATRARPHPYDARRSPAVNHSPLSVQIRPTSHSAHARPRSVHCSPRSLYAHQPLPYYASPPAAPRTAHIEVFADDLTAPDFGEEDEFAIDLRMTEGADNAELDGNTWGFEPERPSVEMMTGTQLRELAPSPEITYSTNDGLGLFQGNGHGLGFDLRG